MTKVVLPKSKEHSHTEKLNDNVNINNTNMERCNSLFAKITMSLKEVSVIQGQGYDWHVLFCL